MKIKIEIVLDKTAFKEKLGGIKVTKAAKLLDTSIATVDKLISGMAFLKLKTAKKITARLDLPLESALRAVYIKSDKDEVIYSIEPDPINGMYYIEKTANYITSPRYLSPGTKAEMQKNLVTILKEWKV